MRCSTAARTRRDLTGPVKCSSVSAGVCWPPWSRVPQRRAAQGYQGICAFGRPTLPLLLARSREEEPELEIRVFELPSAQQLKGLHNDLLDSCRTR